MAKTAMPGAHEMIYHEAIGYSFSESPLERIVYIWPVRNHVTLGFFFGAHLGDPERLLEGEGNRMRHVKVKSLKEAGNPALKSLVKGAWAIAPDSIAKLKKRRKNLPKR